MDSFNKIYCPNCQCELMPTDKFCKRCGTPNPMFGETPVAPQPSFEDAPTEFIPVQPQNVNAYNPVQPQAPDFVAPVNYEQPQAPNFVAPTNYEQTQAPNYASNTIPQGYTTVAPNMAQPTPPEKKKSNKGLIIAISIATSVLVIVGILLVLISTHVICINHDWEDATCTEPKTCSYCGKTEGDVSGHQWKDATCTEPKTCTACKKKTGEALGHTDGEWVSIVEATLVSGGTENLTCSVCGEQLDEQRSSSKKDAKVERASFNFKDDEFCLWLEDVSTLEVGQLLETTDDGSTMYQVTSVDGEVGVLFLAHVNDDPNNNVEYIMIGFVNKPSLSAAAVCYIGEEIDSTFDSSTAGLYIYGYDSIYEAAGMTTCMIESDGYQVGVLIPTAILSEIQSA